MSGDIDYSKRAVMLIRSVYGEPPDEGSSVYDLYSEAVQIQADHMEKQDTSAGLKKLSLGDYSEEYSTEAQTSDELISDAAQALLAVVYPRSEVVVS